MSTDLGNEEHRCVDHFREWLRVRMTGCRFASSFASRGSERRVAYYVRVGHPLHKDIREVNAAIEGEGREKRFVVVLFPHVRSVSEIATLLAILDADERWGCTHVPWRDYERADAALIGVNWRTEGALQSSVMGFAPLGVMPVTRRAPFVGLALWPGGLENPYRKGKAAAGTVGLVDGVHGMEPEDHDAVWAATEGDVASLFSDPPEDAVRLRKVGFCMPRAVAGRLTFKNGSSPPA